MGRGGGGDGGLLRWIFRCIFLLFGSLRRLCNFFMIKDLMFPISFDLAQIFLMLLSDRLYLPKHMYVLLISQYPVLKASEICSLNPVTCPGGGCGRKIVCGFYACNVLGVHDENTETSILYR